MFKPAENYFHHMSVEKQTQGSLIKYRLFHGNQRIEIDINPGREYVAFVKSQDFNFIEYTESSGVKSEKILKNNLDRLGLRVEGNTEIAGVFVDEFSIVLYDGSKLFADKPWVKTEKELFHVKD